MRASGSPAFQRACQILYIADSGNSRIRKVAGGVMTTILGPDASGKSPLHLPTAVAIDGTGDLYVADSGNGRIQFLTPFGIQSTLPGAGRDLALDAAAHPDIPTG